ncbi:preprotein translocase subunit SecA, partial [Streptomyces sp. NPDC001948]
MSTCPQRDKSNTSGVNSCPANRTSRTLHKKVAATRRRPGSSKVDNQLRGRSGRQGDPGESRFY